MSMLAKSASADPSAAMSPRRKLESVTGVAPVMSTGGTIVHASAFSQPPCTPSTNTCMFAPLALTPAPRPPLLHARVVRAEVRGRWVAPARRLTLCRTAVVLILHAPVVRGHGAELPVSSLVAIWSSRLHQLKGRLARRRGHRR
eukprot:2563566-Rhodomonas_salina.2